MKSTATSAMKPNSTAKKLPGVRSVSQRRKPASALNSRASRIGSPRASAISASLRPAAMPSVK